MLMEEFAEQAALKFEYLQPNGLGIVFNRADR
jgi:hypothetical protein